MIELLDDYDWKEAFEYCRNDIRSTPGDDVDRHGFIREDVEEIVGYRLGENDGPNWLLLGRLKDGRWFFLSAGCDYTGWDCQASGQAHVAKTRADIVRFGMTDSEREYLGVALEPLP